MKIPNCIQPSRISIIERRLAFLRNKIDSLLEESIKIGFDDMRIRSRSTFAVINGQSLDNTQYDENCRKNSEIHKKLSVLMEEELELTYQYLELIGKPIRPPNPLKLIQD